jgi:hypothetical protein
MDSDSIAALRARLEEQLRADIALLQEAHRIKLRAFETVWQTQADLAAAPAPASGADPLPASAPPGETKKRNARWSLFFAIEEKLGELPEVFDRNDVVRVLGFAPKRATLFRALDELRADGRIAEESRSEGRQPARFRKLAGPQIQSA